MNLSNLLNYHIIIFVLSYFVVIYIIFYLRNKGFLSSNQKPKIKRLDLLFSKNKIHNLPVIKTGIIIQGFPLFDTNKNQFLMNCTVWFKFNRSLVTLEHLEKFDFNNATNIDKKLLQLNIDGDYFIAEYQVRVEFYASLDHKLFPLNDHSIYIVLFNNELTSEEVIFDCDNNSMTIGDNLQINDWEVVGTEAEAGFDYLNSNSLKNEIPHPKIIYTLNVKKVGLRKVSMVILPIVLIFLISTSVILLGDFTEGSDLSISIGCLTGILAYRYVINSISPNVGYFTIGEYIYNYCLTAIFINFLIILNAQINKIISYPILGPVSFILEVSLLLFYIIYLLYFNSSKVHAKVSRTIDFANKLKPINLFKFNNLSFYTNKSFKYIEILECIKEKFFISSSMGWKNILKMMHTYKEDTLNSQDEIKITVNPNSKVILIVNISNDVNSFFPIISELIKQNILNENLHLQSQDDYIIFHQNILSKIKDLKTVFPVELLLLLKNPKQVFLLQDKEIVKNIWQNNLNFNLSDSFVKKHYKEFRALINKFINHLPKQILLKTNKNDSRYAIQIISKRNKQQQQLINRLQTNFDSVILNLEGQIFKGTSENIVFKIPENGGLQWCLNHSHKNHAQFAMLNFDKSNCYITHYSKTKEETKFKLQKYNLLYGFKINDDNQPIHLESSILIGSSCDLSQSISIFANYIAEGATLKFIEQNQNGGIRKQAMKYIIMNDKYTPILTLENTKKIMRISKNFPMMLNTVGTATTELILPHIINKELFSFFPITGAENLRKEEYENLIFFKASYINEVNTITHDVLNVKKCKRIVIFYQNDGFGLSLLEPTKKIFENYDIKWIAEPNQRNNPSTALNAKKIKKFNPDAIIFYSISIPAISLIHDISISMASNLHLYITSPANYWLTNFAKRVGLNLNYCLATPPLTEDIEIVKDYLEAFKHIPYGFEACPPSLEGYINTSIMFDILSHIDGTITSQKISSRLEQMVNYNFKGLILNYNPKTRELFNHTWLEKL